MLVQVVKSKIHRVKVTGADLNYVGSITIDEDLMNAANIIEGERIQIVNNNNGERLETYVIPGPRKSGEITLNGAAARRVAVGDIIILITDDLEKSSKDISGISFILLIVILTLRSDFSTIDDVI